MTSQFSTGMEADGVSPSTSEYSTGRVYSGFHRSTVGIHQLTVSLVQHTGTSLIVPARLNRIRNVLQKQNTAGSVYRYFAVDHRF